TYTYDLSPKYFGGMGMNFSYKSLQLSVYFTYKKQIGRNIYANGNPPGTLANQPVEVLGRWQNPGDVTSLARFTMQYAASDNNYRSYSDGVFTDASFIRLSNLSLSYSLPASYISKIGLKDCSVFFNTNNLFLITKYKGIDPETQNFGGIPPTKTLVGGISFK